MFSKRVVGALLLIGAIAVYLTIREEGADKAFGGALAPLESVRDPDALHDPTGGLITGNSIPTPAQSNYGQLVDRVRTKTKAAMQQEERRMSRY